MMRKFRERLSCCSCEQCAKVEPNFNDVRLGQINSLQLLAAHARGRPYPVEV